MSSEELFFQSLGINDLKVYQNYKIKEVLLDEKKREFNVTMIVPNDLIPQDVDKLYQACKRGINGNIKVNLTVESNITDKDKIISIFRYVLNNYISFLHKLEVGF